jgi:(p)ppGpp synthase/HD superfamily hydrolase
MSVPVLGQRFLDAVAYANELHGGQARKGSDTVPYMSHLLGVCAIVLDNGGDEDDAVAAMLHDTIEDHADRTSLEEIRERFGDRVARIVDICTDTPPDFAGGQKPPWRERKLRLIGKFRDATPADLLVAMADKVYNTGDTVNALHESGDAVWGRFSAGRDDQLWYYHNVIDAFRDAGAGGPLLRRLERQVAEIKRLA